MPEETTPMTKPPRQKASRELSERCERSLSRLLSTNSSGRSHQASEWQSPGGWQTKQLEARRGHCLQSKTGGLGELTVLLAGSTPPVRAASAVHDVFAPFLDAARGITSINHELGVLYDRVVIVA